VTDQQNADNPNAKPLDLVVGRITFSGPTFKEPVPLPPGSKTPYTWPVQKVHVVTSGDRWGSCPDYTYAHNHVRCNCPACFNPPSYWFLCMLTKRWLSEDKVKVEEPHPTRARSQAGPGVPLAREPE